MTDMNDDFLERGRRIGREIWPDPRAVLQATKAGAATQPRWSPHRLVAAGVGTLALAGATTIAVVAMRPTPPRSVAVAPPVATSTLKPLATQTPSGSSPATTPAPHTQATVSQGPSHQATSQPTQAQSSAAPPKTQTLADIEDTWVNAANPNATYGGDTTVQVDSSPQQRGWIKFASPSGGFGGTVTLRFWSSEDSAAPVDIHSAPGGWSEDSLSWSNAPALGNTVATLPSGVSYGWNTVVVSLTGSDPSVLVFTTSSGSLFNIRSRDTSTPPSLTIER